MPTTVQFTLFALHSAHETRGINDACNHHSTVSCHTVYYVLSTIPEQSFYTGFKDQREKMIIMSLNQKPIWLWVCTWFRSKIKRMKKKPKNVPKQIFACVHLKKHEKQCGQIKKTIKVPAPVPMNGKQIMSSLHITPVCFRTFIYESFLWC